MPTPDLAAVHELCRLALVARRLGCRVRIESAPPELRALLQLGGVGDLVLDPDERDLR